MTTAHDVWKLGLDDPYFDEAEEGEFNNPTPVYRHPATGRFITRKQLYLYNLNEGFDSLFKRK